MTDDEREALERLERNPEVMERLRRAEADIATAVEIEPISVVGTCNRCGRFIEAGTPEPPSGGYVRIPLTHCGPCEDSNA